MQQLVGFQYSHMSYKIESKLLTYHWQRYWGARGFEPPVFIFKLGGAWPPTLQRSQSYMWMGYSQYNVKFGSKYDKRKNYFCTFWTREDVYCVFLNVFEGILFSLKNIV